MNHLQRDHIFHDSAVRHRENVSEKDNTNVWAAVNPVNTESNEVEGKTFGGRNVCLYKYTKAGGGDSHAPRDGERQDERWEDEIKEECRWK